MSAQSDAKQAEIDALTAEIQARITARQAALVELKVIQDSDQDAKDANVTGLVNAIENANGNAKRVLQANLYAQVISELLSEGDGLDDFDSTGRHAKARGRASAALATESGPINPLIVRPGRRGR